MWWCRRPASGAAAAAGARAGAERLHRLVAGDAGPGEDAGACWPWTCRRRSRRRVCGAPVARAQVLARLLGAKDWGRAGGGSFDGRRRGVAPGGRPPRRVAAGAGGRGRHPAPHRVFNTATPIAVENVARPGAAACARRDRVGNWSKRPFIGRASDLTELLRSSDWLVVGDARPRQRERGHGLDRRELQPRGVATGTAGAADLGPGRPHRAAAHRRTLARRLPPGSTPWRAWATNPYQAPRSFAALLERALTEPPPALQASHRAPDPARDDRSAAARSTAIQRALPRGAHRALHGVAAGRRGGRPIVVSDSIVQMTGVRVRADEVALSVTNSELVAPPPATCTAAWRWPATRRAGPAAPA